MLPSRSYPHRSPLQARRTPCAPLNVMSPSRPQSIPGLLQSGHARCALAPLHERPPDPLLWAAVSHPEQQRQRIAQPAPLISRETVQRLEVPALSCPHHVVFPRAVVHTYEAVPCHPCAQAELDGGESIQALRRFNQLLRELPADGWGERPLPPALPHDVLAVVSAWWDL
jgi:hypothetical protein